MYRLKGFLSKLFRVKEGKLSAGDSNIFSSLRKGMISIDCGANVGKVTHMMASTGAKVYAFEPNPFAFKVLQERFSGQSNVECINKGVWDKDSSFNLYFHENSDQDEVTWSTGSSMLEFKNNVDRKKFVSIETVDLAAFIRGLRHRIAILKIDVEGVEIEIINKLIDTGVIHMIDRVYVETHDHKIPELKASTDALRERISREGLNHVNLNWI